MISGQKLGLNYKMLVLDVPSLQEVSPLLQRGLTQYFETVNVSVVDCPDLTKPPFHLAQKGLSGNEKVADIGGPPYLAPLVQRDKYYSMKDMAALLDLNKSAFMVGAGAGPFKEIGTNCELMPNILLEESQTRINNKTHYAKVDEQGQCFVSRVTTSDFGLMANLFASEGKPGKVIRISAKKRIGKENFIAAIRNVLKGQYGERTVSAGGVFLIKSGSAKLHVMPDFSKTPLNTNEEVNNWLKFYNMDSPLICLTAFHSHDPGLDLRIEHTHCFSDHNQGGHYHDDTTPDTVEYEAYLNLAKELYRIDAPQTTHQIGRD